MGSVDRGDLLVVCDREESVSDLGVLDVQPSDSTVNVVGQFHLSEAVTKSRVKTTSPLALAAWRDTRCNVEPT